MDRSSNVYPADIDAMLHDVSNRMARSQLFRRLSANSNNSSPNSRKVTARVIKPQSGNGNPHGVQRRRTTAAPATRSKAQTAQSFQIPQQWLQPAPAVQQRMRQQGLPTTARPMTWHPGSNHLENCSEEAPANIPSTFNTSVALQEASFLNHYNSQAQPSFASTIPQEFLWSDASLAHPSQPINTGYPAPYDHDSSLYQPAPYNHATQHPYQYSTGMYSYDQIDSAFQTTDTSQVPSDYASYSIQHTPTLFSQPDASHPPSRVRCSDGPQLTKQRSKELVGLGLYDGPGRKELSTLNSSPDHIDQVFTISQGKGLKLEETWQPPNGNGEEAEQDSSEDEIEEMPQPASTQAEFQQTFIPTYGDLSNQSFFFESDDPYTDFMPFDQGFQVCQSKGSDPSLQNFMWF
ncbi:MAG: hypothetical protein LQ346_002768 [Caloplaca aetnensis]|nr:MAG: hypothetical protein LQ346_002768 [Caloplaca aetnensis]